MNSSMVQYPQTNKCSTEKNGMEEINHRISMDAEKVFTELNNSL